MAVRMSAHTVSLHREEELVPKTQPLTFTDLQGIVRLGHVDGDMMVLTKSPKGWTLKKPARFAISKLQGLPSRGLAEYIVNSLIRERPSLIAFVLDNQSLVEMANYLLRYQTGSLQAFYTYTQTIKQYSDWIGYPPDRILHDLAGPNGLPDPERIAKQVKWLQNYAASLQDRKLSPGRVNSCISHTKSWYKVNGATVSLPYSLPRRVTKKDRAPKLEEAQRVLNVCDLREATIVSMTVLGGFREETLTLLRYRHVREDLEAGRTPIHVHIEIEITKGKYASYDTFLGAEAAEYLRLYLEARRRGSPYKREGTPEIPPEEINDESPLIRDSRSPIPKPVGPKQIRKLVHNLYVRAGLLQQKKPEPGSRPSYELKFHSLRKTFKTQMEAAGVKTEYVEYMMGHKRDTYHDIESLGIEKLRNIYASANLSIRPRTTIAKLDLIREFAKGIGVNPENIQIEPDAKFVDPLEREKAEIRAWMTGIRDELRKPPMDEIPRNH